MSDSNFGTIRIYLPSPLLAITVLNTIHRLLFLSYTANTVQGCCWNIILPM